MDMSTNEKPKQDPKSQPASGSGIEYPKAKRRRRQKSDLERSSFDVNGQLVPVHSLQLGKKLGEGEFGPVFTVTANSMLCALKTIDKKGIMLKDGMPEQLNDERKSLLAAGSESHIGSNFISELIDTAQDEEEEEDEDDRAEASHVQDAGLLADPGHMFAIEEEQAEQEEPVRLRRPRRRPRRSQHPSCTPLASR